MLKEDHVVTEQPGISPVERLNALVAADMKAADRLIHKGMASSVELIPDLARHLIDSGGKRLRPLLTLAAAKAGGYRRRRSCPSGGSGGVHPYRHPAA